MTLSILETELCTFYRPKELNGGKHHQRVPTAILSRTCGMSSEFLRREVKPTGKEQLIDGIEKFWEIVDIAKCHKYIRHLKKVILRVIQLEGGPNGY